MLAQNLPMLWGAYVVLLQVLLVVVFVLFCEVLK